MDDSEVVNVLAEFMGLCDPGKLVVKWPTDRAPETGEWFAPSKGVAIGSGTPLPDYLTDYNAIAPVMEKLYKKIGWKMLRDVVPWNWFAIPARIVAASLAHAIVEAKKNDEPDDWVGDNR